MYLSEVYIRDLARGCDSTLDQLRNGQIECREFRSQELPGSSGIRRAVSGRLDHRKRGAEVRYLH